MEITIDTVGHLFAEALCGFSEPPRNDTGGPKYWRAHTGAVTLLVRVAKYGEIPASLEPVPSPPNFLMAISQLNKAKLPKPLEFNSSSKIKVLDAVKVLNANGMSVPDVLLRLLPSENRQQLSPEAEAAELSRRAGEKLHCAIGLLVYALAESKQKLLKSSREVNIDAVAALLSEKLEDPNGNAPHGWGKSSLKIMLTEGLTALHDAGFSIGK